MHADGMGLYLKVKESGKKYWIYRYQDNKRRRDMSSGPATINSLADARKIDGMAALIKMYIFFVDLGYENCNPFLLMHDFLRRQVTCSTLIHKFRNFSSIDGAFGLESNLFLKSIPRLCKLWHNVNAPCGLPVSISRFSILLSWYACASETKIDE